MGEEYRIYLALDKDKWRAVVNTVMNQQVIQNAGNFGTIRGTGYVPNTVLHSVRQQDGHVVVVWLAFC